MKKKFLTVVLAIVTVFICSFSLVACSSNEESGANGHTHVYGDWVVTKEATCLQEGSKNRICSICNYKQTEQTAKSAHDYNTENICKVCNYELEFTKGLEYEEYTENGSTYYAVKSIGRATDTDLIIPAYYLGKEVREIEGRAFEGCSRLTSITIPDSVTSIGGYVFSGCGNLLIYCEAKSKPSGWSSYWNYSNYLVVWNCNYNDIANNGYIYAVIDGVKYALKDNTATVLKILAAISGEYIIHSSVTYKDMPYSVTKIGNHSFKDCSSLTSITIPDSVTSIGSWAFEGCSGLVSVTIPDSVTSIGQDAFCNCSGLTSIIIPDSVSSIGEYAFSGCSGLVSVTIPDSVSSIGGCTFFNCSGLTSITIPDSVTSIDTWAFFNCSGLTSIIFKGTSVQWNAIKLKYDWNENSSIKTICCTDEDIILN